MRVTNGIEVGIIGNGVVGGSLSKWLKENTKNHINIYDPALGFNDDLSSCEVCFIAVPVPTIEGGQDISILEESVKRCPPGAVIFVRSTVLPGTCDKLFLKYKKMVCHAPEFLTERSRDTDMNRMKLVLGYPHLEAKAIIANAAARVLNKRKAYLIKPNIECELGKYIHNCHGAMKVNFFNMARNICVKNDVDYESMLEIVHLSGYVGKNHTQVPGPDGKFGYGGTCFPKDMKAFIEFLPESPEKNWLKQADIMNEIYRIK